MEPWTGKTLYKICFSTVSLADQVSIRDLKNLRSELDNHVNLRAELKIEDLLQRLGKIEEILAEHINWDDE